MIAFFLKVTR